MKLGFSTLSLIIFTLLLTISIDSYCMLPQQVRTNNTNMRCLVITGSVASIMYGMNSYCLGRSVTEFTGLASENYSSYCHVISPHVTERIAAYGGVEGVLAWVIIDCVSNICALVRQMR